MSKLFVPTKIIIAAILAILTAKLLNLDFAISAGIVAILSIQPTKKETIQTALSRAYAFASSLIISFFCFKIFDFTTTAFFIFLFIYILLCYFLKWYSAMAMNSVLISHFISLNNFGFAEVKNEVLLFVIGVSFGIGANLFLRKKTDKIEMLKNEADEQIKQILHRMSLRIMDLDFSEYSGKCFTCLDNAITEAKIFAKENANNQFFKKNDYDTQYIQMRENQKDVLYEIYKCIIELKTVPSTAKTVSDFFEKVSVEYEKNNDVLSLIEELNTIHSKMKSTPLPTKRSEFEDRALLFIILKRLNEFLELKKEFIKNNNKAHFEN